MKVKPVFMVICVCLIVICITSSLIYNHESREDKQVISTTDTTEVTRIDETKEIVENVVEPTENYPKETTRKTTETTSKVVETVEVVEETTEEVGGETSNLVNLGKFKLTAYCSCNKCCGKWAGGTTASGTTPKANHTIAVDTSIIPFGTEVIINGVTYVAEDTGGAIKGNRIDVYFDSHQAALNFGVQYAEVYKVVY